MTKSFTNIDTPECDRCPSLAVGIEPCVGFSPRVQPRIQGCRINASTQQLINKGTITRDNNFCSICTPSAQKIWRHRERKQPHKTTTHRAICKHHQTHEQRHSDAVNYRPRPIGYHPLPFQPWAECDLHKKRRPGPEINPHTADRPVYRAHWRRSPKSKNRPYRHRYRHQA